MNTKKLNYNEIQINDALLSALPLKGGETELPTPVKTKAVLMGVEYMGLIEKFQKETQEILKKLKPEGFDERARKMERLQELEKLETRSEEEEKEAEELRPLKPAFGKEQQQLIEEYNAAISEKSKEEVEVKSSGFTSEDMQAIIETLSGGDDIEINGNKIPRLRYLMMVAKSLKQ